jgi:hypothetical protein
MITLCHTELDNNLPLENIYLNLMKVFYFVCVALNFFLKCYLQNQEQNGYETKNKLSN